MASFPLFKLGALLAKQISKPLSKIIKEKAANHPKFKMYLVLPTAQAFHRFDINFRMRLLGLGNPEKVQPLTEKQAIELGAELIGETFVFGVAVAAILLEYWRQSSNKAAKDLAVATKIDFLGNTSGDLVKNVEQNTKNLKSLSKSFEDQQKVFENMNKKVVELEKKANIAKSTQSTQTIFYEKPVGKIMYPRNAEVKASSDVRNTIIYQSSDNAVYLMTRRSIAG